MRKTVPEKTLITCDRCSDGCGQYGMWLKGSETYRTWDSSYGGNVSFDLCAECVKRFREFMKATNADAASRATKGCGGKK